MAERRIRIPKAHAELVERLTRSGDGPGPFRTMADVLAFSAALGARRNQAVPFDESSGDPIRIEVFERGDYGRLINLLAVFRTQDPHVLADSDEMEEQRASVFEAFANGGLGILEQELRGAPDLLDALLPLVARERDTEGAGATDFDLRDLIATST